LTQKFKYGWQEAVFEAVLDASLGVFARKDKSGAAGNLNASLRSAASRPEEHLALHAAFRSLRRLLAQQSRSGKSQEIIA